MLALVLAHGHTVGAVEEDIGGHQGGVSKQACVHIVGMGSGLVLELGHAAQFAVHGVAVQDPGQLCVLGHVGLDEDDALLGVQTAGDELGEELHALAAQVSGILADGDGVHVSHAVQGVVVVLESYPVAHSAQVVAQSDLAAGLGGTEDDLFIVFHGWSPLGVNFDSLYLTTNLSPVQQSSE